MSSKTDFQLLRDYLRDQKLQVDDRVPPERVLAEHLGMTRSRLRTCLAKLEKAGLIKRHVGQGTFIAAPPAMAAAPQLSPSDINTSPAEIFEARLAIEPMIAALAAQRAVGAGIEPIFEIVNRSRAAISWEEWSQLDCDFHRAVALQAGNSLLLAMLDTIHLSLTPPNWGRLSASPAALARREVATDEHQAIITAIFARNSMQAAQAMRAHLNAVRSALLKVEELV